jgi:ATP-dependent DNA helicase RecG
MAVLNAPLDQFAGISPKKIQVLKQELNIHTLEDLLQFYPFRYEDRTQVFKSNQLKEDMPDVQLVGVIEKFELQGSDKKQRLVAKFTDETGSVELVWFQGIKYVQPKLAINRKYLIFGKPMPFQNRFSIAHPELELYYPEILEKASRLHGVYSTTEKMKRHYVDSKFIAQLVKRAFVAAEKEIAENLPHYLVDQYKLVDRKTAFYHIHFPPDQEALSQATRRIKFDELFFLQLRLIKANLTNKQEIKGFPFKVIGTQFNDFFENHLPFQLTNAQKRVIKEIRMDMAKPIQMNRLLQGDVGSGKTLVALMCMLIAIDNGFQACLMAPTELLAQQHYISISELLKNMPLRVELLTGSSKKKHRTQIHEGLIAGEIHILIGTHALLEPVVKFNNLGLAVIDEQHRFGVQQRSKLWAKNTLPPHILIMSATPIPRTLAMTIYGDLDVSVIDELPAGRKAIQTKHFYEKDRAEAYRFIRSEIVKGRQAYIVYPLIEESETLDYKNLMEGYENVVANFPEPHFKVNMVHGQMKPEEKEREMQEFVQGRSQILMATTVIEVGINVPNATVMMIESSERFGLSQLHQLRGRVGRGAEMSYCMLLTGVKLSADSRKRIHTMVSTTDGFKIAEVDLMLRGPGDLMGTQQSGLMDFKLVNLAHDQQMVSAVRSIALSILQKDPDLLMPEHDQTREHLRKLHEKHINWGRIS